MPLVNYSKIVDRFSHIDAKFVACNIAIPSADSFYTVELYPWWEHPLFLKAREDGTKWGFQGIPDDACQHVTVYPRGLLEARITPQIDVIDWDFTRCHKLLWKYENVQEITCNSRVSVNDWMDISGKVCELLNCTFHDIDGWAPVLNVFKYGQNAPFFLGRLPRPLAVEVCRALDEKGIRYFAGPEPEPRKLPVLFHIDGEDYIIADDFEVDLPEFTHNPDWFHAK